MVNVEPITTPAAPVSAAELRAHLRLNDMGEDGLLAEFLAAACERFEDDTHRPLMQTTYRQHLGRWPCESTPGVPRGVILGRGGVTSVVAVRRCLADGGTQDLTGWAADLKTAPPRVQLAAVPTALTTAAGVPLSPVGVVEFVAGWATAAEVPKAVLVAVKMLAGHWYENREAYRDSAFELRTTPDGWRRVVSRHRLGLFGPWGQQ